MECLYTVAACHQQWANLLNFEPASSIKLQLICLLAKHVETVFRAKYFLTADRGTQPEYKYLLDSQHVFILSL